MIKAETISSCVEAMYKDYYELIVPALKRKDYSSAQRQLEDYISMFTRDMGELFDNLPLGLLLIMAIDQLYKNTIAAATGGEPVEQSSIDMVTAYINQSRMYVRNQRKTA